jgi:CRP-like cAMP-binding protein
MESRGTSAVEAEPPQFHIEHGPGGLSDALARFKRRRVNPDVVLFREGQLADGVYVLHAGEVILIHALDDGSERGRLAAAGQILGISAVMSGCAHHASAIATTACEVGFIERNEFRSLIDGSPVLWFAVLRQLSQDVNESYSIIRGKRTNGMSAAATAGETGSGKLRHGIGIDRSPSNGCRDVMRALQTRVTTVTTGRDCGCAVCAHDARTVPVGGCHDSAGSVSLASRK